MFVPEQLIYKFFFNLDKNKISKQQIFQQAINRIHVNY